MQWRGWRPDDHVGGAQFNVRDGDGCHNHDDNDHLGRGRLDHYDCRGSGGDNVDYLDRYFHDDHYGRDDRHHSRRRSGHLRDQSGAFR